MNIVINRAAFSRAVALVASVVPNKPTIPMVGMVRVVANTEGLITVTGTDLSCSITARVEARVDDGGGVAIAKGDLIATLSAMPEGEVSVEVVDGKRIALRAGKRRIAIPCVSAADFPHIREWPDARELHVKAEALARVLAASNHARHEDLTRPMSCTQLESPGAILRALATDGHKLAVVEEHIEALAVMPGLTLPHGVVAPLRALLDADDEDGVAIARHESVVGVRRGATTMIFTEGPEGFPPCMQMLKSISTNAKAIASRTELAAAIKAVQVASERGKDESHKITLAFESGCIKVKASDKRDAHGSDEVTASVEGDATIYMNATYVLETLAAITTPDVIIAYSLGDKGALDPVLFRPTEGTDTLLVMPQRP